MTKTKVLMRCFISMGVDTEDIQFIPMAYIRGGTLGMGKAEIGRAGTDIHNLNHSGFNLIISKYKEKERLDSRAFWK